MRKGHGVGPTRLFFLLFAVVGMKSNGKEEPEVFSDMQTFSFSNGSRKCCADALSLCALAKQKARGTNIVFRADK